MTTPAKRACERCEWWEKIPICNYGNCRRNAPRQMFDGGGNFPTVEAYDWCGEFKEMDE